MTRTDTATAKINYHYYLRVLVVLVGLAVALSSLVGQARSARAAFPGANGKIVFVSDRDGNREIYSMNPDGSNQKRLTQNVAQDSDPAVSPDGTKIAFTSDRDAQQEIYVMNLDGSNQRRLTTDPANDRVPSWSPHGTKIAYENTGFGNVEIFVMDALEIGRASCRDRGQIAEDAVPLKE